jgi:two-component system sensor histidine kinase KdpD
MPTEDRVDLLGTIIDESERLNRFISNLLDMTRLESGAVRPNQGLHDLSDIVGAALRRAGKVVRGHGTRVDIAPDLPMLLVDPVLFEQVLFNLLDNAAKYAPAGTEIGLRGWLDSGTVLLQVMDEGPGIPEEDVENVFDSFYRVRKTDHVSAGTGLGLSICRGFVEAMGGTIIARNRTDRSGAVFTTRMPVPSVSTDEDIRT